MWHAKRLIVIAALLLGSTPLKAASLIYSGFVSSSLIDTSLFVIPNSLVGEPFSATFELGPVGSATLLMNLPFNFPAGTSGLVSVVPGGINFTGPTTVSPTTESILTKDGTFSFALNGNSFAVSGLEVIGFMHADNSGFINLDLQVTNVSPVPLPPALPMFASALLALGIFGVYARRKQAPQSFATLS
jgi:hypothetical protein